MPERSSKRKARRDSVSSSIGEPETSSLRTENFPSISDKDFSELSEKIEKSVYRRIKDTEVGQREILKMTENLSSKTDSLSDNTLLTANTNVVESDLTEPGPSSQREDIYELPHGLGQHIYKIQLRPHQFYNDFNANKLQSYNRYESSITLGVLFD